MAVTYLEAIREAQTKLLREDERVFIYGQDIAGKFGGAFKATKGLAEKFPGDVLSVNEHALVLAQQFRLRLANRFEISHAHYESDK